MGTCASSCWGSRNRSLACDGGIHWRRHGSASTARCTASSAGGEGKGGQALVEGGERDCTGQAVCGASLSSRHHLARHAQPQSLAGAVHLGSRWARGRRPAARRTAAPAGARRPPSPRCWHTPRWPGWQGPRPQGSRGAARLASSARLRGVRERSRRGEDRAHVGRCCTPRLFLRRAPPMLAPASSSAPRNGGQPQSTDLTVSLLTRERRARAPRDGPRAAAGGGPARAPLACRLLPRPCISGWCSVGAFKLRPGTLELPRLPSDARSGWRALRGHGTGSFSASAAEGHETTIQERRWSNQDWECAERSPRRPRSTRTHGAAP